MELEGCALQPDAKGDTLKNPAIVQPVSHYSVKSERRRDRGALKEFALARAVLGQDGDGNVEARESGEATEDEKSQTDRVSEGSETNGEGDHGGCNPKGDLEVGMG